MTATNAYRYRSTDVVTGAVKGDNLPLTMQSVARVLSGSGTGTGALNLTAGTAAEAQSWRLALARRRSVLWVLLGNVPVWNGIVWDWPHQSALDGTLPISTSTLDSLFAKRLITDDLTFDGADVFDIFRGLASYALTKDQNCAVAGLDLGTVTSGVTASVSYSGADRKQVSSAWSDLIATYGFEYAFRPGLDASGNLATFLDLGMPELGQQFPQSGLAFNMPGNLADYRWQATGSTSFNKVIASASDSGTSGQNWASAYPHGYDVTDLAGGTPLLEESVSLSTVAVGDQATVDAYADGILPSVAGSQLTPLLIMGNGVLPTVRDITLGSWCQLGLTSPLHPATGPGEPGYQGTARITSWTLYPPSATQAESTQIQTWIPDGSDT